MALARMRQEDGFSLVELLVVMLMMGFILSGLMLSGTSAQRLGTREKEASQAVRDGQSAAYTMTRELRQATQILPAGATAGQCPAGTSANCVEFLERTRTIDPATSDHTLQRVRIDCTVAYALNPSDTHGNEYRSCARYVSADPNVPPTASTGVLVPRVINWAASTCNAKDAAFTCPIFSYRVTDATQASGWGTAAAFTSAQRIDVTLQVPSRGEAFGAGAGTSRSLLVQDSAQLRNVLR
jgi:prepilin-type N-terminal cleavage/methylation domain-containing protein